MWYYFNPCYLLYNCQNALKTAKRNPLSSSCLTASGTLDGLPRHLRWKQQKFILSVANGDRVATDYGKKDTSDAEKSELDDGSSSVNELSLNSSERAGENSSNTLKGSVSQLSEMKNDTLSSTNSKNTKEKTPSPNPKPSLKRSPLTAREKLRAAKVLSRYTESKATKPELGSRVLEVLKESDKGKRRPGLPEAPTNLFDDSKRGMPKPGWTFEFPGGFDVFLIAFSFVFISSVMFATTFLVWKAGGIHYNEF
ncbi:OLC1v1030407C2 [Oldenlandia corymbosa var. corymbosa]|uniref:OLC1v1030407C2 n=1 Tax=Oldenlandia corymbosa var. corymbosa TaxID=529605 RepID=A0AAV1CJG4_OLDCO|nr:OLC1v1030407C2 [Oldenlandia corymbosa var. corymbosa]